MVAAQKMPEPEDKAEALQGAGRLPDVQSALTLYSGEDVIAPPPCPSGVDLSSCSVKYIALPSYLNIFITSTGCAVGGALTSDPRPLQDQGRHVRSRALKGCSVMYVSVGFGAGLRF